MVEYRDNVSQCIFYPSITESGRGACGCPRIFQISDLHPGLLPEFGGNHGWGPEKIPRIRSGPQITQLKSEFSPTIGQ